MNEFGQALKYPFSINIGKPELASSRESIEQGIIALLNTPKGSRFYLPEYGSRLHELLFDQNDEIIFPMIRLFVVEAIKSWERRVSFVDIFFAQEGTKISCDIYYKINNTNNILNFIYPFYN